MTDPYRDESSTELFMRKKANKPLNVLVWKQRGEFQGRIVTMLQVAIRYNYTLVSPYWFDMDDDSPFQGLPTGKAWNLSDGEEPTTDDVLTAIEEIAKPWSFYQKELPEQWNVVYNGGLWN